MRKRKWLKILFLAVISIFLLIIVAGSNYLVSYAFERGTITNVNSKKKKQLDIDKSWLAKVKKTTWYEKSATNNLRLVATYVPAAKKTNKTIIVAHGYHESHLNMASYIRMFHSLGYNVLAPDDRGSGQSQGKYLTFGWLDRLDYVKWIKKVINYSGENSKIGLFGVSMGAATVMMTSGEKLPSQVKAIVADCGYSSVSEELTNQLKQQFNLPKEPIIAVARIIAKLRVGFDFGKASSTAQLKKNKLPTFFIHGDSDTFVATNMVYKNFHAQKGPKKLWITKNTTHAMSYYNYPKTYKKKIGTFFAKKLENQ
ncbi:alpha/beta hydrolase [Ligilactobacillus sp. WILCCON 0076]|uniref:Alpha/beta hydrolase n=1 Tax=Ligilactobacillus ubinensis TaxID=2876789 RepID=A0A9X2FIC4_9LACO|nr:alpha/beta hydrolase [Ligilactobacillus ubinensis]MCP0886507.1 alpha/beta hydrolase [Ligilactobacillus ubinensis]